MKEVAVMSNYELARFERRLRHDIDSVKVTRQKPSKRVRVRAQHERDQMKAQLDAIASEWVRREAVKEMAQ